ncbi:concanavalin A-like lectin/glucanase [Aureobasidium pullulans]|nr:concanavalin A-like lectin/glucanase [Aureobasidium pullulans]
MGLTQLATFFALAAVSIADTCNPLNARCPPNVGLATSAYEVDFTKQSSIPSEWTISDWATVKFGSKGAEFTVSKRFESPQLWTNFYIHYGKVEIVAQVAPGTGIVSSAVLMSDDADEIDWEWSGNNFRDSAGKGQNNYYGKGIVGDYDRGSFFSVASPQTQFHTYTIDWTSTALTWSVDGTIVRTLLAANTDSGSHQYPQTPAKFQLGIWAGGDPGNAWGTVDWAGGYTDFTKAPFTMYVKSVKITNYNPAYAYNWTDSSGSSKSIKIVQKPVVSSSSTTTTSPPTSSSTSIVISSTQITSTTSISVPSKASTTCAGVPPSAPTQNGIVSGCTQWYTAKSGDTCSKIAAKFSIPIEQFMDWNPAVDAPLCYNMWLNYGYCVSTDCALVSTSSAVVSTSSTSTSSSTSVTPSSSSSSTIVVSSTTLPTTTISPTSNTSTPKSSSISATSTTTIPAGSQTTAGPSTTSSSTQSSTLPSIPVVSLSATVPSSSAVPSSTPSSTLCPETDGLSLLSQNKNAYTIRCSSDTNKGSYTNTRAADSYLDCMDACDDAANSGCKAWTYVGGTNGNGGGVCWLKSTSGNFLPAGNNYISGVLSTKGSSSTSTTRTVSSTSSSSSAAPSQTTSTSSTSTTISTDLPLASPSAELCPEVSSQSFVASQGGSIYFMRCSSDTNIGSYSNSRASTSYKDCMDGCDKDSKCQAFTYVGGTSGKGSGQCWYKDTKGSVVPAGANYVAGFLAARAPSSGSSASSIATGNLAVSSKSSTSSSTTSSSSSSTSTASTSWATNSAGSNYTVYRSSDTNWGAYTNVQAKDSFLDCTIACDNDPNCKAYTYVGGKSGSGPGVCWLKSKLGEPVPANDNVISGSRVTQSVKMRRAVSSWWNSVTSKPTATTTKRVATVKPKAPANPPWARYYPHGGRWMWNGHGEYEWAWN